MGLNIPGVKRRPVNSALNPCSIRHCITGNQVYIIPGYSCVNIRMFRIFFNKPAPKTRCNRSPQNKTFFFEGFPGQFRRVEHEDIDITITAHPGITCNRANNHPLCRFAFIHRLQKHLCDHTNILYLLFFRANTGQHGFLGFISQVHAFISMISSYIGP